jgi:outer membrane protein OmpA-like peptidoglycan-associated protein
VKGGAVDFTDRSVPGDFHATVREISVRVTGISSEPGKVADVQAQALLPRGAPLRIRGRAAFLRKQAFADLDLTLEKLELSTATPYAGAYLGLEVDEGTLTVKSRAKVDQGRLAAENRIRVDQLGFGESVKSDRATILPVQLIVDILRDKNGDIVLDLPVSASTDDQDLAGTVVKQAVSSVLFPPSSPLRNIDFAGCSADLTPDAQGRLLKLAAALQERSAMKVFAVGYVDREDDGEACRELDAVEGDARMRQLAEGRAAAVRNFLVAQGNVDPTRVFARIGDVHGAPKQAGDRRARVEFARATD